MIIIMASAHNSKCCAYAARARAQKWAVSRERYEHTQAHTHAHTQTRIVHTHKYLNSKSSKLEYGSNSITSSGKCDREKESVREGERTSS